MARLIELVMAARCSRAKGRFRGGRRPARLTVSRGEQLLQFTERLLFFRGLLAQAGGNAARRLRSTLRDTRRRDDALEQEDALIERLHLLCLDAGLGHRGSCRISAAAAPRLLNQVVHDVDAAALQFLPADDPA